MKAGEFMSMDNEQTKIFAKSTLDKIYNMLDNMCNDENNRKKAEIITYWLNDYKRYLE